MKLRRFKLENVRSFLEPAQLLLDGDISILIGPNGGGKTNLLDAITTTLRRHILTSWVARLEPTNELPSRRVFQANDALNTNLDRHSTGAATSQKIEVELEVTGKDIENLRAMKESAAQLTEFASKHHFHGASLPEQQSWNLSGIEPGTRFTYAIINNGFVAVDGPAAVFHRYLANYEMDAALRAEAELAPLSTPLLSLPVNRAGGGIQSAVSLASFNDWDFKKSVDAASSRQAGSIGALAVGRLASKYRILLEKADGETKSKFFEDPQVKAITRIMSQLGYEWRLDCTNPLANRYDLRLTKQGSSFLADAASSGEKELLTYVFAIYALNVRDALIVIDEPELHLHPKWQATLLKLFESLAKDTGNQFLLATHSPVFVAPSSIQYVSRVFTKAQQSQIVRLQNAELPEAKHLFSIVNTQNNERVFFADKVVLVEGISDKLFFEKVCEHRNVGRDNSMIYEIVSVGGKMQFEAYSKLLRACQVPFIIVADLDYVFQVGGESVKALFATSAAALRKNVVDDKGSLDGQALIRRLDEAIESNDVSDLKTLWNYIKERQRKLRKDLTLNEKAALDSFIMEQRRNGIYILSMGALEEYLPAGYRGKDIDKLIRFVNQADFWEQLPLTTRPELETIAAAVASK